MTTGRQEGGTRPPPRAATSPRHEDPRLRGRRYAIPFQRVWSGVLELASGKLRGWTLVGADEIGGTVRAESRTPVFRFVDDVEIRVGLDRDGQTRVDLTSRSRKGIWDLGTNARRIRRFLHRLDRELDAEPHEILRPELGARPSHEAEGKGSDRKETGASA